MQKKSQIPHAVFSAPHSLHYTRPARGVVQHGAKMQGATTPFPRFTSNSLDSMMGTEIFVHLVINIEYRKYWYVPGSGNKILNKGHLGS